jgi:hypothetical protein
LSPALLVRRAKGQQQHATGCAVHGAMRIGDGDGARYAVVLQSDDLPLATWVIAPTSTGRMRTLLSTRDRDQWRQYPRDARPPAEESGTYIKG